MRKNESKSIVPDEVVINKIYILRGEKVMLDRDLAELYDIKPIRLREQVKRNIGRFPERFMMQLTEEEVEIMVSQNAIPSKQVLGGSLPYAFTEHGVLMLSTVLKSDRAIEMNIQIVRIFNKMREMLLTHKDMLLKIEKMEHLLTNHDQDIAVLFDYLKKLLSDDHKKVTQASRKRIGFKNEEG